MKEIQEQYSSGLVTNGERYNKVVDIWSRTNDQVAKAMMEKLGTDEVTDTKGNKVRQKSFNSIFMMADSGARGSAAQIRQLAGMRGLMAKPDGSIIETPITANFREGLNVLQYFISTHGARKGLADTALKTANSGYLTRRLVDVAQDLVVTEIDCGTVNGLSITPIVEGGDVVEGLGERVLGRVVSEDVVVASSGEVLVKAGVLIDEKLVKLLEKMGIDQVMVRSPITCETRYGVCAQCYGRDLGRGHRINIGEAVGVIAAQSIGEPGTQLTMRTFHVGGAASRAAAANGVEVKSKGTIRLHNIKTVRHEKGHLVAVSRSGELGVVDEFGRERERYKIPYGATITVNDARHRHGRPIGRELGSAHSPRGHGSGGHDQVLRLRRRHHRHEPGGRCHRPHQHRGIGSEAARFGRQGSAPGRAPDQCQGQGSHLRQYRHSGGLCAACGRHRQPGGRFQGVRGRRHRAHPAGVVEDSRHHRRSAAGGRPVRGAQAEGLRDSGGALSGTVSFGKETKGKRRLIITNEGTDKYEELIPKWRHLNVFEGEQVEKGEVIADGEPNPHDILRLQGVEALANYLVREIQDVYRLQGVKINDKHIEVIVRQMLRKIEVLDAGDSALLRGEQMDRGRLLDVIAKQKAEGKHQSTWEPHAIGHHQGVFGDRVVHFRSIVPGDHARPHRGGGTGPQGRPAGTEGKRHRRPPDSRGHRLRVSCATPTRV